MRTRLHHEASLARAAAADNDLKQVSHVLPSVKAHAQMLGEDYVSCGVFVPVLFVQFTDIAPYMDMDFKNNIILTKTEMLTMNNWPADPKTARNKNVLIIGGSGSGKTRFWLKPSAPSRAA